MRTFTVPKHCGIVTGWILQMDAANQLEKQGGLDIIAINALVAALATADRIVDAEKYLRKAVVLTQSKGRPHTQS